MGAGKGRGRGMGRDKERSGGAGEMGSRGDFSFAPPPGRRRLPRETKGWLKENPLHPRITVTVRPAGVVAGSVVVRSLMGGKPLRRSNMTSQPVSSPSPLK